MWFGKGPQDLQDRTTGPETSKMCEILCVSDMRNQLEEIQLQEHAHNQFQILQTVFSLAGTQMRSVRTGPESFSQSRKQQDYAKVLILLCSREALRLPAAL
jgi:hypothetical protein